MADPTMSETITIIKRFQVECAEHGIVDEPRDFDKAIEARRDHWAEHQREADGRG